MSELRPTTATPATVVTEDVIDTIIWNARRSSTPYRRIRDQLLAGVPYKLPDESTTLIQADLSHEQIRRRFLRVMAIEVPPQEKASLVAEQRTALDEAQRVAMTLMGSTNEPATRLAAVRALDRVVRTRAALLGLNAPDEVQVTVGVESKRARVLELIAGKTEAA